MCISPSGRTVLTVRPWTRRTTPTPLKSSIPPAYVVQRVSPAVVYIGTEQIVPAGLKATDQILEEPSPGSTPTLPQSAACAVI